MYTTAGDARRAARSGLVVDVSPTLLQEAAGFASAVLRSLDAIHLASALWVSPDEVLVYDARLAEAMAAARLPVASPGA